MWVLYMQIRFCKRDLSILGFAHLRGPWISRGDCACTCVRIHIHIYSAFSICILFTKQLKYREALIGTLWVTFFPFTPQRFTMSLEVQKN